MILKNNLGVLGGFGGPERSWEVLIFKSLKEFVTDLLVERTLRVRRDFHIGRVMIRLVDELGKKKKKSILLILADYLRTRSERSTNEA